MNDLRELQKLIDEETGEFRKFSRKFYFIAVAMFMSLAFALVLWDTAELAQRNFPVGRTQLHR